MIRIDKSHHVNRGAFTLICKGIDDQFARRLVWLPIGAVTCFAVLIYCAYPQMDDFCFAQMVRDQGLGGMILTVYRQAAGRVFSEAVVGAPFEAHYLLGGDILVDFRILCGAALGVTIALALWTGHALLPSHSNSTRLLVGLVLAVVLVAGNSRPLDIFYYSNGIGTYGIPAAASMWMMIWLGRQASRAASIGLWMVGCLMAVGAMVGMSNEISGPIVSVAVLASLLYRWMTPGAPRQPLAHVLILAAIIVGVAVDVLAPGNWIRMHDEGTEQGSVLRLLTGMPMSIGYLGRFLFRRLTNPALIAWIVFLVLVLPSYQRPAHDVARIAQRSLAIWLPLATALVGICAAFYIEYVAIAIYPETRSLDQLHFALVGGLTLSAVAASPVVGRYVWDKIATHWPRLNSRKLAIASIIFMLATPGFLEAVRILPYVAALHNVAQKRFALLGDGRRPAPPVALDLVLSPAWMGDSEWFRDPVSENPSAYQNGCIARLLGVRSVRLASPSMPE